MPEIRYESALPVLHGEVDVHQVDIYGDCLFDIYGDCLLVEMHRGKRND